MVELINQDQTLLPNFEIVYTEVLCGPEYFDYEYFYECLSYCDLGNFYIHGANYEVVKGIVDVLRDQNRTIP